MRKVIDPAARGTSPHTADNRKLPVFVLSAETCDVISTPTTKPLQNKNVNARPTSEEVLHSLERLKPQALRAGRR